MPITNLAIQKRRMHELARILMDCKKRYENLSPFPLTSYNQFVFIIDELNLQLVEGLEKRGYEICWVQSRNGSIRLSVYREVTPEKANIYDKQLIAKGAKTRVAIERQKYYDWWLEGANESGRLQVEIEAKEKTIVQLCNRIVALRKEKEELASVGMLGIFFNQVEAINHE